MPSAPTTAIIGAGLSGLACARALLSAGLPARVFDKGRGPGGRLSTRRVGDWRFDHGGQYLTARDPAFRAVMNTLIRDGHAAPWPGRLVRLHPDGRVEDSPGERFVGLPGMNGLVKALADGLDVTWSLRVSTAARTAAGWHLVAEDGTDLGTYDRLVVAVPSPQAMPFLEGAAPALAAQAAAATMAPCWTAMLALPPGPHPAWAGAFVAGAGGDDRPLSWLARDGAKPGRGDLDTWVLHAAPAWSARHLEETPEQVLPALLSAFRALTGLEAKPTYAAAHRWRYALPTAPLGSGYLLDWDLDLGACGDWCLEARGEAAWVSGHRLGQALAEAAR